VRSAYPQFVFLWNFCFILEFTLLVNSIDDVGVEGALSKNNNKNQKALTQETLLGNSA